MVKKPAFRLDGIRIQLLFGQVLVAAEEVHPRYLARKVLSVKILIPGRRVVDVQRGGHHTDIIENLRVFHTDVKRLKTAAGGAGKAAHGVDVVMAFDIGDDGVHGKVGKGITVTVFLIHLKQFFFCLVGILCGNVRIDGRCVDVDIRAHLTVANTI